ncbi:MAG: PAS domain-containing protein, partial [Negativicutes bacterium]|nr:PAS domain-containing protein [Negativicutes bacterium]
MAKTRLTSDNTANDEQMTGVAITNSSFRIMHWSEAMTALTGFREDESIHRDFWKLLLSDEMRRTPGFRDLLASFLFEGGRGFSRLLNIIDKHGRQLPRTLHLNHVMLDGNDYWFISMRPADGVRDGSGAGDLSWNQELIDHIPAGVVLIDSGNGLIAYVNIMASRLLGTSREELVGSTFQRYYYPKNADLRLNAVSYTHL